jgi:hypothetical protein
MEKIKISPVVFILSGHYYQEKDRCLTRPQRKETFEKGQFLFRFKEGDSFNHMNTLSILRINPPRFGGGLKFEYDPREIGSAFHRISAEIGQKGGVAKVSQSSIGQARVAIKDWGSL